MSEQEWVPVVDGKRPQLVDGTLIRCRAYSGSVSREDYRVEQFFAWDKLSHWRLAIPAKPPSEPVKRCCVHWPQGMPRNRCASCEQEPQWVRCDVRLPGEIGRVYARRGTGELSGKRFQKWLGDCWGYYCRTPEEAEQEPHRASKRQDGEWLDEAPAQAEQGQEAGNGGQNHSPTASKEAPAGERCQSSLPPGTITRALRIRQQQDALVAQRREFHALFGRSWPF